MIVITLPPKANRRELFPQLIERANQEKLLLVNGRPHKFARSMVDGQKQKIWKGEACPICKRNHTAFKLVSLTNQNIKMKACVACKKAAILGIGE